MLLPSAGQMMGIIPSFIFCTQLILDSWINCDEGHIYDELDESPVHHWAKQRQTKQSTTHT